MLRNPKFNRPWQLVLEPLKGYLILAKKQFENPSKFSDAWNFGTESKSVTDVQQIVKYMIEFWGKGKMKTTKKNKFYEQENLQLDITKAKNLIGFQPKFGLEEALPTYIEHLRNNPI